MDEKKPRTRKYATAPPDLTPLNRTRTQKTYFFLDSKLYKVVRQDRAQDLLTAWDFEKEKLANFVLSDAKRKMKGAYDTKEVAKLLNRHHGTIRKYVNDGVISHPMTVSERGMSASNRPFFTMKWSEDDILALHDYLLTVGAGRPRNDGTLYSGTRLPTRKELLALIRQQPMFYMRTSSGEVVPVWSAYNEV